MIFPAYIFLLEIFDETFDEKRMLIIFKVNPNYVTILEPETDKLYGSFSTIIIISHF